MTETTSQKKLRPTFWESVPLNKMTDDEWEALCDGCGRCCLNKLEDPDTGHVALTRIACRLLDNESCRCAQYDIRHQFVPECIRMTSETIAKHAYWLPNTCAYYDPADGHILYTCTVTDVTHIKLVRVFVDIIYANHM